MANQKFTGVYEGLPKIAKIIIQIILGAFVGGVYRIFRFVEDKNTTTLVVGILALIPIIDVVFWVLDLISEIMNNKITLFVD